RTLCASQSGRRPARSVSACNGVWESTTDVVFGGHCMVAENGVILAEAPRFRREETLLVADVDLDRLRADRLRTNSFGEAQLALGLGREFRRVAFTLGQTVRPPRLAREGEAPPFVPPRRAQLRAPRAGSCP